jgi:hypothetical protein
MSQLVALPSFMTADVPNRKFEHISIYLAWISIHQLNLHYPNLAFLFGENPAPASKNFTF